jgi:hypothetical protein
MGPNVHVLNEGMPSGHVFFRDFVLIIIINNIEFIYKSQNSNNFYRGMLSL